jgi:aspartate-semialdehyde dehydrogenase
VGVLGATGAVGQRFLQYLDGHPWFEVVALGASERSAGKKYEAAAAWQLSAELPDFVRGKTVVACSPAAMKDVDVVFSALVRGARRLWRRCGARAAASGRGAARNCDCGCSIVRM